MALIDRMFRKSSSDVELISSDNFQEFFQAQEPFIDEWLKARCATYGQAALSDKEKEEYYRYQNALKQAISEGRIRSSEDYDRFSIQGITHDYMAKLETKMISTGATLIQCESSAIVKNQKEWASHN